VRFAYYCEKSAEGFTDPFEYHFGHQDIGSIFSLVKQMSSSPQRFS